MKHSNLYYRGGGDDLCSIHEESQVLWNHPYKCQISRIWCPASSKYLWRHGKNKGGAQLSCWYECAAWWAEKKWLENWLLPPNLESWRIDFLVQFEACGTEIWQNFRLTNWKFLKIFEMGFLGFETAQMGGLWNWKGGMKRRS